MPRLCLKSCVRFLLGMAVARAVVASAAEPKVEDLDFFEKRIRPVLVDRCYKCHSATAEKLKGGLRLDTKEGMLKGGDSEKPAITPGDPDKSQLIEAIRYVNEDLQMPPPKEGKLTDAQVEDFIAWVKMGAPDPRIGKSEVRSPKSEVREHWAFRPPKDNSVPPVKEPRWPKTPVDFFVLAKLDEKGLQPSAAADKRTLIRRATFDLIGLPPTPKEVDAFLKDKSSEAFARVVDRLLSSPRYGERWGRYWLDAARYADTKGYVYSDREEGRFVHSHTYRDWVIRAFNEDMPYDKFLMLQIAADQIVTGEERSDLAAMGYLTLGRRFLGVVHDIIDDRIDVVMRGTQALTVGCARCHDHKYDPIPTRDYYSLYGVFAGGYEKLVQLDPSPEKTEDYLTFEKELKNRTQKLEGTFQKKRDELTDRLRQKAAEYLVAVLDADKLPTEEHYEIRGPDDLNPTIVRQWQAYLFQTSKSFHPVFAAWHALSALSAREFAEKAPSILEGFPVPDGGVTNIPSERVNPLVMRGLVENPPKSMRDVAQTYGRLFAEVDKKWRESRKASTNSTAGTASSPLSAEEESLRRVLYGPDSPASVPPGSIAEIEWFFEEASRIELAKLQAEIERWVIKAGGAPPYSVVLEDRPVQKTPRVFKRGNPANKGEEVPRQFLEVLSGDQREPFRSGSGRLELAKAIASRDNPLTARVIVNRVWLHHFGAGLVKTPSDFGTRSEPPSHPELLDWLATWFMDNGWSLKKLHRLILLSAVYQQSSDAVSPVRREHSRAVKGKDGISSSLESGSAARQRSPIDPENRLLWRFNRQRLDFEAMRDSLLAVSGELDAKMGGKPTELFKKPSSPRRSIYGFIDRQFLPGVFRVFDFANPDMHSPQRSDTTVPQQALFFMNSPFVAERARALCRRPDVQTIAERKERIRQLYRLLYQREPTAKQTEEGLQFIKSLETEPPFELSQPPPSPWRSGYGEYDEAAKRVKSFQPLPHFTGEAWQGGEKWPDEKLGWVQLTADGGHAGNDLQHAAIRRWVSPADGKVSLSGEVKHEHKEGDGIRAWIVSSRQGVLGSWTLQNKSEKTKVDAVEVQTGDTIDFVVDYHANLNSDDFVWAPTIKLTDATGGGGSPDYGKEWSAKKDFSGPPAAPPKPLDAWEQYAQVLLLANEFVFVD